MLIHVCYDKDAGVSALCAYHNTPIRRKYMAEQKRYVYPFEEAYGLGKELLGGKGAGLAEMTHIGVPVPEGFTISTEACTLYYQSGKSIPEFVRQQIFAAIEGIEKKTGKKFGGDHNPLLVSVRSGARVCNTFI